MNKLVLISLLFLSAFSHAEKISLKCEIETFYSTFYYWQKEQVYEGKRGREKKSTERIPDEYILLDKNSNLLEMGTDKRWTKNIRYNVDEEAYSWGPIYTTSVFDGASSFQKEITAERFLNPRKLGDSGNSNEYKISRGSLQLEEINIFMRMGTNGKSAFYEEKYSKCSIITIEELNEIRENALVRELEREKTRKEKQKI